MPTSERAESEILRPAPKFEKWLRKTGPKTVAANLESRGQKVSKWTVYSWIRGAQGLKGGTRPRQMLCSHLVALAGSQLKASDIYPPPRANGNR